MSSNKIVEQKVRKINTKVRQFQLKRIAQLSTLYTTSEK